MSKMDSVLTVAVIAAGVTKAVDFFKTLARRFEWEAPKSLWIALAFGFGVGAAYLLDAAGYVVSDGGETVVATGVAIAGLSSGWHEFFHMLSTKAHKG